MNKIIYVSILLMLMACGTDKPKKTAIESPSEIENPMQESKTIMFFGNSLTAGYQLDMSEAFPALVQERLDSMGMNYQVINAGLSGETTAGGNSRVDWVLKTPVDIFVLELGANDGLRGISTDETRKNLREILEKVKAKYPECQLVLTGMRIPPNMGPDYTADFRKIFPEIASEYEIPLIPFLLEGVAGNPELNLEDGIHPTAEGHKIMLENVWKILFPLLKRAA